MNHNRIVIYSNGIADFQRSFNVKHGEPARISIPVRKDHIADVLASLNVFGEVVLASPPSYRPANESAGTLTFDPQKALEDLAVRLSGARVAVDKAGGTVEGTLVGLHVEPEGKIGERIFPKSLVVLVEGGLVRIPLKEVQKLRIQDEAVQKEIHKALQRSVEQIKPNSTFVELTIQAEGDEAAAVLQYTLPAAAWKISYRLRDTEEGQFEFQGFAVVDNNTEEDWKNCLISVVTGEPITFSTDLADSKVPLRSHVNVVKDSALGAVEVAETMLAEFELSTRSAGLVTGGGAPAGARVRMLKGATGAALMAAPESAPVQRRSGPAAKTESAEVREVGDFCVFECRSPVSIDANRSAVLPVFQVGLSKARSVLHYKTENHAQRPFRTIKFLNETDHSLGRGVCTIYHDGTYAGSCIMPATQPGKDCLLPHALETGVKILQQIKRPKSTLVGIRLSEGSCYTSYHEKQETLYRISSSKDEAFDVLLDHDFRLSEPQVECSLADSQDRQGGKPMSEPLKDGVRVLFSLPPRGELLLRISEARTQHSSVELVDTGPQHENIKVHWLQEHLVSTNGPLANDPGVRQCLEIQRALDDKQREIRDLIAETERLAARQERLRKNLGAGGHDDQTAAWRHDLGEAERRINDLEESAIPQLREEEQRIRADLREAVVSLIADWKAE